MPYQLATCNWFEFLPDMGAPIRVSMGLPRFQHAEPLAYMTELTPRHSYFRAEDSEFTREFLAQLDRYGVEHLYARFNQLSELAGGRPLVLLCFEKQAISGDVCHRRLFAEWWMEKTGEIVPELGYLPPEKPVPRDPDPTLFD